MANKRIEIEPSLLAFDLNSVDAVLQSLKNEIGVKYIHYDIMDGKYVKETALPSKYMANIHNCGLKSCVHLMVVDPLKWCQDNINYKMHSVVFHPEVYSEKQIRETFSFLKTNNILFGLAITCELDISKYQDLIAMSNYVCVMSVTPGACGRPFNPKAVENIKLIFDIKQEKNKDLIIQLDGGIDASKIQLTYPMVDHYILGSALKNEQKKQEIIQIVKNYSSGNKS